MHLDDVLTDLVEQSGDRLLRVAYQLTYDAAAAQDLVQEALRARSGRSANARPRPGWYVPLLVAAASASSVMPVVRQLLKPA